jgi:excisionase family DNA binding protein
MGMDELTVTEAAARLDRTVHAVRSLIHRGRLPARRVGPIWLIPAKAVDAIREELAAHAKRGRRRSMPQGPVTGQDD